MLASWFSLLLPLASLCHGASIEPPPIFCELEARYSASSDELTGAYASGKCRQEKIGIRRSWDSLSDAERREYIRAVKCLHSKPTAADPQVSPGNRNRMDDFTFSHINVALFVHASGFFLPWHRYFIWAYEKSLREECRYDGYQPYWDFSRWSGNQLASPVFDGSSTSLGGDGEAIGDETRLVSMPGLPVEFNITVHAGTGGGCIASGPFANFNVSLGPVVSKRPVNPSSDPFGIQYNPHCLIRSFWSQASTVGLNWDKVMGLLQSDDIHQFRGLIEADDLGVHVAAHEAIGGDAGDFFTSPGDPIFYLLHAQIDRLWTIWQGQDWAARTYALDGTGTFQNLPPSPNVTTETLMDMGYAGGQVPIGDVMSPIDGPFCYKYE